MADFPNYNVPGFPYANIIAQLNASMGMPVGSGPYGRFQNYPSPASANQYPGGLLGGAITGGNSGGYTPNAGGSPSTPAGNPAPNSAAVNDPGFGAAPSSAAFPNLTDADKAYLYRMEQQYRQDMRNQPGAHQLYFDLFGGQYSPEQINGLINDTGLNNNMLPSFNVNDYNGPLKAIYANLVQQNGGTVNPYGTSTSPTYRRTPSSGGLLDFKQYFAPGGAGSRS